MHHQRRRRRQGGPVAHAPRRGAGFAEGPCAAANRTRRAPRRTRGRTGSDSAGHLGRRREAGGTRRLHPRGHQARRDDGAGPAGPVYRAPVARSRGSGRTEVLRDTSPSNPGRQRAGGLRPSPLARRRTTVGVRRRRGPAAARRAPHLAGARRAGRAPSSIRNGSRTAEEGATRARPSPVTPGDRKSLASRGLGSRHRRAAGIGVCAARPGRGAGGADRARRSQGLRRADAQRNRAHRRRDPQRPRVDRSGASGRGGKRHRDGARRRASGRRCIARPFGIAGAWPLPVLERGVRRRQVGAGAAHRQYRGTTSHGPGDGGRRPSCGGDGRCLWRDVARARSRGRSVSSRRSRALPVLRRSCISRSATWTR